MPCYSTMLPAAAAAESATLFAWVLLCYFRERKPTWLYVCLCWLASLDWLYCLFLLLSYMFVLRRLAGWLAWQTHCSWVACWLHASSSCDQKHRTQDMEWTQKLARKVFNYYLAGCNRLGWLDLPVAAAAVRAANGGLQVCECAKRIWPLHAGNSLHPTNFLYLASASWCRPSLSLSPDSLGGCYGGYWGCDAPTNLHLPTRLWQMEVKNCNYDRGLPKMKF